jgi:hypothetical protein
MSECRSKYFELRSLPTIALAYAVAPIIALLALWVCVIPFTSEKSPLGLIIYVVIGGPILLASELIFVTPLLFAYRKYRWQWFGRRFAILSGLAVGSVTNLVVGPLLAGGYSDFTAPRATSMSSTKARGVTGIYATSRQSRPNPNAHFPVDRMAQHIPEPRRAPRPGKIASLRSTGWFDQSGRDELRRPGQP